MSKRPQPKTPSTPTNSSPVPSPSSSSSSYTPTQTTPNVSNKDKRLTQSITTAVPLPPPIEVSSKSPNLSTIRKSVSSELKPMSNLSVSSEENQHVDSNHESIEQNQEVYDPYNDPNVLYWVTTLYAYTGNSEQELSFQENEYIGVYEDYGDGWANGVHATTQILGVFPLSYTASTDASYENNGEQYDEGNNQANEQQLQRRKEVKEKLKGEMKDIKEEQTKQQQKKEQLEKEIKQMTEDSQKLKKELRNLKADLSDKGSLLIDLIKLTYGIDLHSVAFHGMQQQQTSEYIEAVQHFSSEYQKEAKNSPGLVAFSQKTVPKLKDLETNLQLYNTQTEEGIKLSKELKVDLETLIRVVDTKAKK